MENIHSSPEQRIKRYRQRLARLKSDRDTWLTSWRDIAENVYPWLERRLKDNADYKLDNCTPRLEHSAPAWAINVLAAGLTSGMTPQSRKWFKLSFPNDGSGIDQNSQAKDWLYQVEEQIHAVLHKSNAYDILPSLFLSLSLFGTAVLFVDADDESIVRFYQPQNGTYVLAQSGRQVVNFFMREIKMTASELVDRFGMNAVSDRVRRMIEQNNYDELIDVVQVIEPFEDYNPDALDSTIAAPYRGVFFEQNQSGEKKFLEERGFYELPLMAARWEVFDGEVYGIGPGHKSLGDCQDLRRNMTTQAKLLAQLTTPPLYAPSTVKMHTGGVNLMPGAVTYYDPMQGPPQIGPLISPNPNALAALIQQEEAIKLRIQQAFFVDVFLAVSQAPIKSGVTATEILERYQEKLLMLGPVLERVNSDLLDPMIKRVYGILARAHMLPPPPPEVMNTDMKIEYVSTVALGQQATTVTAIDAFAAFLGSIGGAFPDALDLLDTDKAVRLYASLHDLPPSVVRDQDTVDKIRADRQQMQEQQQQMMEGQQMVEAAKTMSEADTGGGNLLSDTKDAMAYLTGF